METQSVHGLTVAHSAHIEIHLATLPGPVTGTMTEEIIAIRAAIT